MGGVDNKDKSIYHTTCDRPTKKYWKKIFYNLTDMALFDAYILYQRNTDKPLARREFLTSIVREIMDEQQQVGLPAHPAGDIGHALKKLPSENN